MSVKGTVVAAMVAGLFAGAAPLIAHADAPKGGKVKCEGGNACKGKSACKTAANGDLEKYPEIPLRHLSQPLCAITDPAVSVPHFPLSPNALLNLDRCVQAFACVCFAKQALG